MENYGLAGDVIDGRQQNSRQTQGAQDLTVVMGFSKNMNAEI